MPIISKISLVAFALLIALTMASSIGSMLLSKRLRLHEERVKARPGGKERMLQALQDAIDRKSSHEINAYLSAHEAEDIVAIVRLSAIRRHLQRISGWSLLFAVGAALASGM